jgi:hypothetical protein
MGGHGARAAVEVSGDGETANGVCGDGAEEREEVQREQRRGRERGSKRLWPVHNRFAGPGRDFGAAAGVAGERAATAATAAAAAAEATAAPAQGESLEEKGRG